MSKQKLLKNLQKDTYCRLKPSKGNGVGVFAIRDIPKGKDPFVLADGKKIHKVPIEITKKDIKKHNIPPSVVKMVEDFVTDEGTRYFIPALGLNSIDISFYMNHSVKGCNVDIVTSKKSDFLEFRTARKIKKNEELFINYSDYDD